MKMVEGTERNGEYPYASPRGRDELDLHAGDSLTLSVVEGRIVLEPEPHDLIEATYGLARGMWGALGGSAAFLRETEESWRV